MEDLNVPFVEVHYVTIQKVGDIPIAKGDLQALPQQIQAWIAQMVIDIILVFDDYFLISSRFNCVLLELFIFVMVRKKKLKRLHKN